MDAWNNSFQHVNIVAAFLFPLKQRKYFMPVPNSILAVGTAYVWCVRWIFPTHMQKSHIHLLKKYQSHLKSLLHAFELQKPSLRDHLESWIHQIGVFCDISSENKLSDDMVEYKGYNGVNPRCCIYCLLGYGFTVCYQTKLFRSHAAETLFSTI